MSINALYFNLLQHLYEFIYCVLTANDNIDINLVATQKMICYAFYCEVFWKTDVAEKTLVIDEFRRTTYFIFLDLSIEAREWLF